MELRAWLQENPGTCLGVLIGVTALAVLIEIVSARRRRIALRKLAAEWGMTYSPTDRLRLLARISGRFPVPGAADLDVTDVIYGSDGDQYRYVFSVRYTVGIIRGKRSISRVAGFSEARGRHPVFPGGASSVTLADEGLSLVDQYRSLDPKRARDDPAGRSQKKTSAS
jgi:hypothetical protein